MTGKNKEKFDDWYILEYNQKCEKGWKIRYSEFPNMPIEFQIGVYETFYFEKYKYIMTLEENEDNTYYCKTRSKDLLLLTEDFDNPIKAKKQWLEDMDDLINDEIINKQLNKI